MPPKVQRTPKKEESQEEEELGNLVFLRDEERDRLERLKVKLAATGAADRTATAAEVHQRKLYDCNEAFKSLQQQIYRLAGTKKRDVHKGKSIEFESLFDELAMTLGRWVAAAHVTAVQQPIIIQQPLPRIIPTFDGKYENWEKFKTIFQDVVDRTNESPRIKLYHLEEALVGEAVGILDAKTVQDGNYDHAWNLLEERYEDKRRMVDLHIGGLLAVKKLPRTDHSELRSLIDNVVGHVENLKFLGQEFSGVSELIVIHLLGHALDDETRKLWESTVKKGELPNYPETIQFLKDRVSVLERCETTVDATPREHHRAESKPTATDQPYQIANAAVTSRPGPRCDFCSERHLTFKCAAFQDLTVCQRMEKVKEKHVCFNCLRAGHCAKNCRRTSSCGKCQRRHHTLLHDFYRKSTAPQRPSPAVRQPAEPLPPVEVNNCPTPMLQTAVVDLGDGSNRPVPCRILLDSGSQVNFISTSMADRLKLKRVPANVPICGIGGQTTNTRESTTVQLQSRYSGFTADVECLVVPKVTGKIPSSPVNTTDWPIPKGFQLADPKFHIPDRIDMLVGASLYFRLLKRGFVHMWDNYPELRETHLGWVVVGGAGESVTGQQFAPTAVLQATHLHQATTLEKASAGPSPARGEDVGAPTRR
ncbi:uncharacterized protein LOC120427497 [Culex pipiens pallens]|uniref:uncharacterized protein LOC120414554 n=1 Tax=Culex pipiens pallens TaxID=42434 RepID=UPI001953A86F|nr:uncharacterized protein LOC120414554 [Culex pipiens pallens]XP_039448286.1 uncharacterized protein LOC120427497 [Culex pipiens pallens]